MYTAAGSAVNDALMIVAETLWVLLLCLVEAFFSRALVHAERLEIHGTSVWRRRRIDNAKCKCMLGRGPVDE